MASIIKADNIQKVSDGTNIIKKCGSTTTIGSGACSPIIICGSTVTLGRCGGTVTLASGATQTGFGRTGTVDWCTTAKTAPFTGVSGKGYFVNTTCGAVTVTLPATPTAGDIISVADYASTWQTNAVTLCRNSSKINGGCFNVTLNTKGQSITLIYVDSTRGWKNTMDSTSNITGAPNFIVATGGTITTSGDYKIHTFTSDGTFTICSAPTPANNNVSYIVVAGGGSSKSPIGAGGGGGGFREGKVSTDPYTASPKDSTTGLPVSITSYPITVGAGGAAPGNNGSNSIFSTITSAGGGFGGAFPAVPSSSGGSGGGAGRDGSPGAGNTPPVSPPQGNSGGNSPPAVSFPNLGGAGGGGATAAGSDGTSCAGGNGGAGATTSISATPTAYAGGGGGGTYTSSSGGTGGTGGGAPGGAHNPCRDGTANTGGGAGGCGGDGGSGIVIIRYKYQ